MKEKLAFVRLPILFVRVSSFVARIALGAVMGVSKESYDISNRVFSMVILQVHVALLGSSWRRYLRYGSGRIRYCGASRHTRFTNSYLRGTAFSYLAEWIPCLTFPRLSIRRRQSGLDAAMGSGAITFIANCAFGAILAAMAGHWADFFLNLSLRTRLKSP